MEFITTTQDSAGPLEVPQMGTPGFGAFIAFNENSAHVSCTQYSVALLDAAGAAWSDSRVTLQSNADGTTSMLVDRSSPQPEFNVMLRATSVGGITVDLAFFVLVQASGTSCSYTGSPATKTHVVPYPITAPVSTPFSSIFTYGSNDDSATACPLNQILWYFDMGSGYQFAQTTPYSMSAASFSTTDSPMKMKVRTNIGLSSLRSVVSVQSPDSELTVVICGAELLNLASTSAFDFTGSVSTTAGTIPLATYSAWFALDTSDAKADVGCGVSKYELFESDQTTAVAASVAYIDTATSDLVIVQSAQAAKTSYYLKATTLGSKT